MPSTCGLSESGLGPNKATVCLSRSIVAHVSHYPLYPLNARHSGSCGGTPTVTKLTYSPECVEVDFCEVHIQYPE